MRTHEVDLIARWPQLWPDVCKRAVAALGGKELPDSDRRSWLIVLKRLSRTHRNYLHWADCYGAMPSAQLAEMWREFVETGLAVCDGQLEYIEARRKSPELSIRQLCALAKLFCTVSKLESQFQRYQDEMIAVVSPQEPTAQLSGEGTTGGGQQAGVCPVFPREKTHAHKGHRRA